MAFGFHPGKALPFMGPAFKDRPSAENIFSEWIRNFGDHDALEQIRVSIIEHSRDGSNPDYHVHISENFDAIIDQLKDESRLFAISRIHKMTPGSPSANLEQFKRLILKYGKYIFVPVVFTAGELTPLFEFGIIKTKVNLRYLDEVKGNNDPDSIVLKENETPDQEIKAQDAPPNPEQLTAMLADFERQAMNGSVPFKYDPMILDRLYTVKRDGRGIVIPESVDPILYALALLTAEKSFVKSCLSQNLIDIQRQYVEILRHHFEPFQKLMKQHGLDIHALAQWASQRKEFKKEFRSRTDDLFNGLAEFWKSASPVVIFHLQRMQTLKAVYGGSGFPLENSRLWANTLVYADTLVVPDPFLGTLFMSKNASAEESLYYQFKHCLNALEYGDLALSDVDPPLVVFLPILPILHDGMINIARELAEADLARQMSDIFEYPMRNYDDVREFFNAAGQVETLLSAIRNPKSFLLNTDVTRDPRMQAEESVAYFSKAFNIGGCSGVQALLMAFFGRWLQYRICCAQSAIAGGVPIIDAPTSWEYYVWGLQHESIDGKSAKDILIQHSLHDSFKSFPFVNNITPTSLIKARQTKSLATLRTTLQQGIDEISHIAPDTHKEIAVTVSENIRNALAESSEDIKNLVKLGASVVVETSAQGISAGLSIAAACQASIPLAVMATIMRAFGVKSVRDIKKDCQKLIDGVRQHQRNPVGLFFK